MKESLNPRWMDYQVRWQSEFSRGARRYGPANASQAQNYISILRVMRRRLLAGGKPSLRDFRRYRKTYPGHFMIQRSHERLDRAFDRGETTNVMRRRGLFDPLGRHNAYQSSRRFRP